MRTRSRTRKIHTHSYVSTRHDIIRTGLPNFTVTGIQQVDFDSTEQSSTIMDVTAVSRPEVKIDPVTGMWKRIRYPKLYPDFAPGSPLALSRLLNRPVQPCVHTKVDYAFEAQPDSFVIVAGTSSGSRTDTYTINCPNYGAYRAVYGGNDFESYAGWTPAYTAGNYPKIDWFALMDSFNQSSTEFVHSAFLGGEDIKENEIFVDSLKLILNPSKAIVNLSHIVKEFVHSKYVPQLTLGQLSKSYRKILKKGVNADLMYKFGIHPAISDIKDTISAHSKVRDRMAFLRQHSDSWVPIRVKQEILASSTNTMPGLLGPTTPTQYFTLCDFKRTTGIISAWGRVRPDLDWNDTWSAYLQYFGIDHIIGLAWELIPYSFVVDWFTNAKERIDYYTRLRTGGPFAGIRNVCASKKEETRIRLMMNPGYIPSLACRITNPVNPMTLGSVSIVSYERYNQIPETSGVVDLSTLGSFHAVTSGELIYQLYG